jgi:threonine/homoserine/homoserine lactone efflux protein
VAGGTLLIVMGAHTAWRARKAADETRAMTAGVGAPAPAAWRGPMAAGVVLSLANPYWLLWWCTIGLHYAALALRQGPVGLGVFYAGHIASDLAWYSAVAAAVAAGRRVFPPAVHRALLTACGLALVALGAWFLGDGAGRFPSVFHGAAAAP